MLQTHTHTQMACSCNGPVCFYFGGCEEGNQSILVTDTQTNPEQWGWCCCHGYRACFGPSQAPAVNARHSEPPEWAGLPWFQLACLLNVFVSEGGNSPSDALLFACFLTGKLSQTNLRLLSRLSVFLSVIHKQAISGRRWLALLAHLRTPHTFAFDFSSSCSLIHKSSIRFGARLHVQR